MTRTVQGEVASVRGRDVGFLLFLTFLNVINYIDRQLLAGFANWIVPELELSNTQFGLLTGLIFIFFYAIMGLFMGALADRVNRTRLIAFGLGLWSILTAVSGAARGFVSLAVPRMFIGVGESILTPASISLIGDRFPARWRGLAVGVSGPVCRLASPAACLLWLTLNLISGGVAVFMRLADWVLFWH